MGDDPHPVPLSPPRGFYPGRVDEKGRLKLPVDFQEYLAGLGETKVFVTSLEGRIGRIYPISEWKRVEELLTEGGDDANSGDDLWFTANAFGGDAELDGQGRVLLPAELRRRLEVENQPVHLHHVRGHIKIYSPAVYEEKMNRSLAGAEDKVRQFERKGLR